MDRDEGASPNDKPSPMNKAEVLHQEAILYLAIAARERSSNRENKVVNRKIPRSKTSGGMALWRSPSRSVWFQSVGRA